jgi:hypothetical protein
LSLSLVSLEGDVAKSRASTRVKAMEALRAAAREETARFAEQAQTIATTTVGQMKCDLVAATAKLRADLEEAVLDQLAARQAQESAAAKAQKAEIEHAIKEASERQFDACTSIATEAQSQLDAAARFHLDHCRAAATEAAESVPEQVLKNLASQVARYVLGSDTNIAAFIESAVVNVLVDAEERIKRTVLADLRRMVTSSEETPSKAQAGRGVLCDDPELQRAAVTQASVQGVPLSLGALRSTLSLAIERQTRVLGAMDEQMGEVSRRTLALEAQLSSLASRVSGHR